MPKTLVLLPIFLLAGFGWAAPNQVDLVAREAFASDADGNPIEYLPGSPVYATLNFEVVGSGRPSYTVTFDTGYSKSVTPILTYGTEAPGTYRVTWGPISTPSLKPIPVKVTLTPKGTFRERNRRNNALTAIFEPLAVGSGLETYASREVFGHLTISGSFAALADTQESIQCWLPKLPSLSWQTPQGQSASGDFLTKFDSTHNFEAWVGDLTRTSGHFEVRTDFDAKVSQIRANRHALKEVSWTDYEGLDTSISQYLMPETLIESNHPDIRAFATKALRKQSDRSPIVIAETLYLATIRHASYRFTFNEMPSALSLLRKKKGDCGAFAALFVAACRTQGLPARAVTGMRTGDNAWHVWAEVYFPGHGWLPVDPSDAEILDPKGTQPLYFGVIPDLSSRIATSVGFDHVSQGQSVPILQTPWVKWNTDNYKLENLSISGQMQAITQP